MLLPTMVRTLSPQPDEADALAADPLRELQALLFGPQRADGPLALRSALRALARAHIQLGEFELALPPALACARAELREGGSGARSRALIWTGLCHSLLGDFGAAERQMRAACRLAQDDGLPQLQASALNNLVFLCCTAADGLIDGGRQAEARAQLARCAADVQAMQRLALQRGPYESALWTANRSGWERRIGQIDSAARGYEAAFVQALPAGWTEIARHAALGLGLIARARGDTDEALRWLVRTVAVVEGPDPCGFVAQAHEQLAQLLDARGDAAGAARHRAHRLALIDRLQQERRRARAGAAEMPFDRLAEEAAQPLEVLLAAVENEARVGASQPP